MKFMWDFQEAATIATENDLPLYKDKRGYIAAKKETRKMFGVKDSNLTFVPIDREIDGTFPCRDNTDDR